jgi:hypothetical protein
VDADSTLIQFALICTLYYLIYKIYNIIGMKIDCPERRIVDQARANSTEAVVVGFKCAVEMDEGLENGEDLGVVQEESFCVFFKHNDPRNCNI